MIMRRKLILSGLAVTLVVAGLWFAAKRRSKLAPPIRQPAATQNTAVAIRDTPATQAVLSGQQPSGGSAIDVPTRFPESSPLSGAISGRVLDSENRPVAGAEVMALAPMGGLTQSAQTNHLGKFVIKDVDVSHNKTYALIASKEEAGYGGPLNRFYTGRVVKTPVEVTVRENQTVSCGDLRLGPRGARLIGTIRDAKTNGPIAVTREVQMVLRRTDDLNLTNTHTPDADGQFSFLVPAAPFTVEVSAPRYEKKELGSIRLKAGEIKHLNILLVPTN
jgi:hypothetical protein